MRIGSLFAGIGGLELGLEHAGIGETVWQVEIDPYCRAVLERHWPEAERFEDVRSVGASTLASVDLICGGFPCQNLSSAGKRAGLAGPSSGLWFEYLRIVSELRPAWVVVENVASGAAKWVDAVCQGLGEQGYACLPVPIAAADLGAPHERRRIFIVAAHANQDRKSARSEHAEVAVASKPSASANGSKLRLEQGRASGSRRGRAPITAHDGWSSTQPDMVRVVHGLSRGMDKPSKRIAALGNSVVPQCAEVVGHVIKELTR